MITESKILELETLKLMQKQYAPEQEHRCAVCGMVILSCYRSTKNYCSDNCQTRAHDFRRRVSSFFAKNFAPLGFELSWQKGVEFLLIWPTGYWFKTPFYGGKLIQQLPLWAFYQFDLLSGEAALRATAEQDFTQTEILAFRQAVRSFKYAHEQYEDNDKTAVPSSAYPTFQDYFHETLKDFAKKSSFECCMCHKEFPNLKIFWEVVSCGVACTNCSVEALPF